MSHAMAVETHDLCHTFGTDSVSVRALEDVHLEVRPGELVVLMGPSGSGKTTMLSLLGCLRSVQRGSAKLLGVELNGANTNTLMQMRRRVGFIFQDHNLHSSLTAKQNVEMGLRVHGNALAGNWRTASRQALELVGLGDRINFRPGNLSGGQKQRIAIARAIVGNPEVIFADEATAALDAANSRSVVELLRRLADQRGTAVLMVTHDHRILDFADRIINMEDGRVVTKMECAV